MGNEKQNQILKYGALALAFVVFLLWRLDFRQEFNASPALPPSENVVANDLKVYFLDVGQGDAEYFRTPSGQDVLIDGGADSQVLSELGQVMPFYDKEIEILILTHPHSDHVAGLVEILRRYTVKQIYYTGVLHSTADYLAWLQEIRDQKIPLFIVDKNFDLQLDNGINLQFLFPFESFVNRKVAELNDTSIVNRLVYGQTAFLFTGDIGLVVEKELLEKLGNEKLASNVLKVSHHGSKYASSEEFLKAVNPDYAIISVGAENDFGHPSYLILNRLQRLNIPYFRTDLSGTLEVDSDSVNVKVK